MESLVTYKSRWVVPIAEPPIPDGYVTVDHRQIVEVSSSVPKGRQVKDLGSQILLPRLVNAHTHLEFSGLTSPFPAAGGFPLWVRDVIKWRQQRGNALDELESLPQTAAIRSGVAESSRLGTALLGEIATSPWPVAGYTRDLRTILFLEQLGILPEQAEERLTAVQRRIQELRTLGPDSSVILGLSPHAPYSLSKHLFEGLVELGCREQLPLAMHLAETREEVEWLAGASNAFTELQERLGVSSVTQWRPSLEWLIDQLAKAPRSLVIHGNYFSPCHWQQLARYRERISVVYCPRTHSYFGHPRYPLNEMLSAGVRVVIGTDSRASNPDLNILEELRLVRKRFPELESTEILKLATEYGAAALGQAGRFGKLAPGMNPEMLTIGCSPRQKLDPIDWLLDSDAEVELLDATAQ